MKVRSAGVLALVGLLVASGLAAQEPEPLGRTEFVGLVNAKTPVADIVAQIKARGVSFEVDPELEESLKQVEGGADLLAAIREPATLQVQVNVPGALVTVDGEERGTVGEGPLAVSGLAPGTHLIRAEAERYVQERVDVFLKPGETRQVEVTLGQAVEAKPGLLGMEINVRAGTHEDALVSEIERISDLAAREGKLSELARDYADSPLSILAYQMLQAVYLRQEQYDRALEAGAQLLERDASNHQARVNNTLAYVRRGELEVAFDEAMQARNTAGNLDSVPQPTGVAAETWEEQKQQAAQQAESQLQKLDYDFYVQAAQVADPGRKSVLLERFLEFFSETQYRPYALVALSYAYQRAGNIDKALAAAEMALEANPDEASMAVLVSDILSDRSQSPPPADLDRAWELASRLAERMAADPAEVRPEGLGDEQWSRLGALWEGTAHSVMGQVLLHQETAARPAGMTKTRQAIDHFLKASPLLKAETQLYARNLFRLGFARAKVGDLQEAQQTLNEVASLNTPYATPARDLLARVQEGLQKQKK